MTSARELAAILSALVASALIDEPLPPGATEAARVALFETLPAYAEHLDDPDLAGEYQGWLTRTKGKWEAKEGRFCQVPFSGACRGASAPRPVTVTLLGVGL